MSPEVRLTRLSVDDDEALNRAVSAYLESVLGCDSMTDAKGALIGYVEGMNNYYGSGVFAIDTSDELSSGLIAACSNGDGEITIEDFLLGKLRASEELGERLLKL